MLLLYYNERADKTIIEVIYINRKEDNTMRSKKKIKTSICLDIKKSIKQERERSKSVKEIIKSINKEDIWVSVSELDNVEDNHKNPNNIIRIAKINILNKKILEYDKKYLNSKLSELKYEEYHPYFVSFIVYTDYENKEKNIDIIKGIKYRWFKARIKPFRKKRDLTKDERSFEGELEIGASPIIYKKRLLQISTEELDESTIEEIYRVYNIPECTDDCDIENEIKKIFESIRLTSSRVYSVGNGNLIRIRGEKITAQGNLEDSEYFEMMYDIGYNRRSYPKEDRTKCGAAIRDFDKVVPNVVFLSHWDDDHIMGCVYARKELFECKWFAPQLSKDKYRNRTCDKHININAVRLATFMGYKNKLKIIRRDENARILAEVGDDYKIRFYLGENKNKNNITIENCGGLVIEVINGKKDKKIDSLFCGDVPYEALKEVLWNTRTIGYTNLVVPHHGSEMDCSALKTKKDGIAIICAVNDESKNRPNPKHKSFLENKGCGYKVKVTGSMKKSWCDLILIKQ